LSVPLPIGNGFWSIGVLDGFGAKLNGFGHVWTFDDRRLFDLHPAMLPEIASQISLEWSTELRFDAATYFSTMSGELGIGSYLSCIPGTIALDGLGRADPAIDDGQNLDLVFIDYDCEPLTVLEILGRFLPSLSGTGSLIINSTPASMHAYLLIERVVEALNSCRIPKSLRLYGDVDLEVMMQTRRIRLMHLANWNETTGNDTAWLKVEPLDVAPKPFL